ncbi:hypothetical protein [Ectopseudomonas khazarica]|uniref:hypothetical protein n=1 Tax=Ectopseudomonas khazarica TaxID=2502979 RepID=UPI00106E6E12|nr:hypothetical protein [Pseudomonas khazarica]
MHSTTHLIIISLIAGLSIGLVFTSVFLRIAKMRIRARGYSDGSQARQPLIDGLQETINEQALEITSLKGQRLNLLREHKHGLDAISQDADARVKLFAQRCLSDHELLWLRRAIKQLEKAGEVHKFLGNSQRERDTNATRAQLQALVSRLQQQESDAASPTDNVRSVIVFGPEACGKTRNAARIAKALGLSKIVDDLQADPRPVELHDTLYLTNEDMSARAGGKAVMTYEEAMQRVAEQEAAA